MPLFFFHLRGGPESLDVDEHGLNLPDAETAYLEAHKAALGMAQEWLAKGRNPRGYAFEVVTDTGELVLELPFSEALDRQAGRRPTHLSREIRMALERGERMMRLSAEVAEQVQLVTETLRCSRDLLNSFGTGRAG